MSIVHRNGASTGPLTSARSTGSPSRRQARAPLRDPASPRSRLRTWTRPVGRALGINDGNGYLTPIWQSFVLGLSFVAISLIGAHAPQPRDVEIDVTGPPDTALAFAAGLEAQVSGGYAVHPVPTATDGLRRLQMGDTYAVLDLGSEPTLTYAGANGPTVTEQLDQVFTAVAAGQGIDLRIVDAVPLGTNDAAGLSLFYLVSGITLASYLFTVTSATIGRNLPIRGHWTGSALLALTLGPAAALFARYGTHSIGDDTATIALLLALVSLATSTVAALFLRLTPTYGSLLATIVLLILATSSGGLIPGEFLPEWLAMLRPVLPLGVALNAIRDTVYFAGNDVPRALLILAAWAILPLLLVELMSLATTIPSGRLRGDD